MLPVESVWNQFVQYGLLGVVLFFIGIFVYRAGRWAGENILLPIATAHIKYLTETTAAMKQIQGDMTGLSTCERELHLEVQNISTKHTDPDGLCSTVHTNNGLQVIMEALVRLAEKHGVELEELHLELKEIVARQKRHIP
jgi:hypothetical protein